MIPFKSKYVYVPVAAFGALLYKFRFGDGFASREAIEAYQIDRLKKILIAAKDVPYYRALFRDIHFDPAADFKSTADLARLPLLEKETLRKDLKHFINPKYRGLVYPYATSGSTAEPLRFYMTWRMLAVDRGMIYRHYKWATGKIRPAIFQLRGHERRSPADPLYRYSFADNAYCFSAYDLNSRTAAAYVRELKALNPELIRGYPSSVFALCDHVTPEDVAALTNLRSIIVSSETLTDAERARIEATFGRPVLNWYGMAEPAIVMKQARGSDEMKIALEYGFPEFLDTDRDDVKRLVATSYDNVVMPFIRYATGDLVQVDPGRTTQFGTCPYVKTVIGRKDEVLIGPSGARLPSINFYTMLRSYPFKSFQFVQFTTLEVLFLYSADAPLAAADAERLKRELQERLGEVSLTIRKTDTFVTNRDGKRLVVVRKAGALRLFDLNEYAVATQKAWGRLRNGEAVAKLDWNEADATPAGGLREHLKRVLDGEGVINWYPEARHERLLEKIKASLGAPSVDHLLLTHGSDSAIRIALQAFAGGSVTLTAHPNYDQFRGLSEALNNRVEYFAMKSGSVAEAREFAKKMSDLRPAVAYLTNPNNPIGYAIEREGVIAILEEARKGATVVVLDEAYAEFAGTTSVDLVRDHPRLVVLRTFSKAYGLAGLRLGYAVAQPDLIEQMTKVANPKDVTSLAVEAALYALDRKGDMESYVERVNRNKEIFYEHCRKHGIAFFPSHANFVSFAVDDVDGYLRHCDARGVFLRDRRKSFGENVVRVTIGAGPAFDAFLQADREYRGERGQVSNFRF